MASVELPATCDVAHSVAPRTGIDIQLTARELRELQKNLLHAISGADDTLAMMTAMGRIIDDALSPLAIRYFGRTRRTAASTPGGSTRGE